MIPEQLVQQVARDEGFRSLPYKDSEGFLTIGHGILIDTRTKGGISVEESELILRHRLEKLAFDTLPKKISWYLQLDEVRRSVLVNMAYNLGVNGLLKFTKTLAYVRGHDWNQAAAAMLDSKWARQVGKRAERLAQQMKTGEWQ